MLPGNTTSACTLNRTQSVTSWAVDVTLRGNLVVIENDLQARMPVQKGTNQILIGQG